MIAHRSHEHSRLMALFLMAEVRAWPKGELTVGAGHVGSRSQTGHGGDAAKST